MSLAVVYSRASLGIAAPQVTVEVHLSNGLPAFNMVGLPETSVKESRDRVRSALLNGNFEFPSKHITVNLAPADLPKEGGRFDLAIAIGILAASKQIPAKYLLDHEFLGELALTGEIRPVLGVLPAALACRDAGRTLLLP
ncbi:MAG: magnesium chelatase domain-containing protein, partial [Aeromonas veronii]